MMQTPMTVAPEKITLLRREMAQAPPRSQASRKLPNCGFVGMPQAGSRPNSIVALERVEDQDSQRGDRDEGKHDQKKKIDVSRAGTILWLVPERLSKDAQTPIHGAGGADNRDLVG